MQKLTILGSFLSLKSRKLDCTLTAGSTFLVNAISCSKRANTVLNHSTEAEVAVTPVPQTHFRNNVGQAIFKKQQSLPKKLGLKDDSLDLIGIML